MSYVLPKRIVKDTDSEFDNYAYGFEYPTNSGTLFNPTYSAFEAAKTNLRNLLLTAKGEAKERVEGLEIGADDYLPKPFEPKELILRIKNILSKTKKTNAKRVVEFDNILNTYHYLP